MRRCKLLEAVAMLSADRQVFVTSLDRGEAGLWRDVATEWGVAADVVDLNGGKAVLRPGRAPEEDPAGPAPGFA